jgi:hypothetical protein
MPPLAPQTGQIILQAAESIIATSQRQQQLDLQRDQLEEQQRINEQELQSKEALIANKEAFLKLQQDQFAFKQSTQDLETQTKVAELEKTRAETAKIMRDIQGLGAGKRGISVAQTAPLTDEARQFDVDEGLRGAGLGQFSGTSPGQLRTMLGKAQEQLTELQSSDIALVGASAKGQLNPLFLQHQSNIANKQKEIEGLNQAVEVTAQFASINPSPQAKAAVMEARGLTDFQYEFITQQEQDAASAAIDLWQGIPETRVQLAWQAAEEEVSGQRFDGARAPGFRRLLGFVRQGATDERGRITPEKLNKVVDYLEARGATDQLLNSLANALRTNAR